MGYPDGPIDVLLAGTADLGENLAGRRVRDVDRGGMTLDDLAPDAQSCRQPAGQFAVLGHGHKRSS